MAVLQDPLDQVWGGGDGREGLEGAGCVQPPENAEGGRRVHLAAAAYSRLVPLLPSILINICQGLLLAPFGGRRRLVSGFRQGLGGRARHPFTPLTLRSLLDPHTLWMQGRQRDISCHPGVNRGLGFGVCHPGGVIWVSCFLSRIMNNAAHQELPTHK